MRDQALVCKDIFPCFLECSHHHSPSQMDLTRQFYQPRVLNIDVCIAQGYNKKRLIYFSLISKSQQIHNRSLNFASFSRGNGNGLYFLDTFLAVNKALLYKWKNSNGY